MYSDKIQDLLEENNIEVGDRIKVGSREGVLMPKPSTSSTDTLIIKLDSGYNIGLVPKDLELVSKKQEESVEKTEVPYSDDKPDILVLHTGGTIASRVSYEKGGVKPAFDPEDLVEMYPELTDICNLHSDVIAQMLSEDMEPAHWQKIAEEIDRVKDDYDGIIVGHGTDTLGYTGAALTLMLQNIDTGVMLVGSQRSSDRPSSDAATNLYSAIKFLNETSFNGIGVCMHANSSDQECVILPAAKARKMHTSRRDAFKAVNKEFLGSVNVQNGEIKEKFEENNGDYNSSLDIDSNVGFLKVRPGMNVEELEFLLDQDYDGLIIEGTGLGHMPVNSFDENTEHHQEILDKVSELAEDCLVVMTSQCINGRVDMDVYDAGLKIKDAGVIEAKDMHPELAYVKLMWSLGNSESLEEAEELFGQNIGGEVTERSLYHE